MRNTAWRTSVRGRTVDSDTAKGSGSQQVEPSRHLDPGSGAQEEIVGLEVLAQGHGYSESNGKPENE